MKTKFISIILLGASLGLGSCSDYLDMTPTDKASDKLVWSKLEYAEQAVNDFYRYIDYLGVNIGAENMYFEESGAYTGEIRS